MQPSPMTGKSAENKGTKVMMKPTHHDRRSFISGSVALAAAGTVSSVAKAQQSRGMARMKRGMTLSDCVQDCLESHKMCLETARYCMDKGGKHVSTKHLSLLLDCAEICQTTANSLLRRSSQHAVICEACARVCEACASDCDSFAADAQMRQCALTCRTCAQSCRDMVGMAI